MHADARTAVVNCEVVAINTAGINLDGRFLPGPATITRAMDDEERVAFTIRLSDIVNTRGKGRSLYADGARWINTHRHCQSVTPRPAMIERNIEHIINGVIRAHDIGARNQMARLLRIGGNLGLV